MEESADNSQVSSDSNTAGAALTAVSGKPLPSDAPDDLSRFTQPDGLVHIAAFDFDGTCISGNSPVLLVRRLMKLGMLEKSVLARILLWGIAYKLRLPQNESWVRGLVFRAFAGEPVSRVDDFLCDFYDSDVACLFREHADAELSRHKAEGRVVVLVSATFEPIARRAMETHPIDFQIATRMRVAADGSYTCDVEGLPVEGDQKIVRLHEFADERFGAGKWVLDAAYGDHHSDRTLLGAAVNPVAVTPDRPLARTATREGWRIAEW